MKNIHILPTDQPSRLAFDIDDEFYLLSEDPVFFKHQNEVENRNIYITSYEEIKEGDWCIDLDTDNVFRLGNWTTGRVVKIILTTAPTLIADGVQGIYDEFLEWFVKNPTCEFVEVKKGFEDGTNYGFNFIDYKITIPQEETLEEAAYRLSAEKFEPKHIGFMLGVIEGAKWQAKRMYSEEDLREAFKQSRQCKIFGKDMSPIYKEFEDWFTEFKKTI